MGRPIRGVLYGAFQSEVRRKRDRQEDCVHLLIGSLQEKGGKNGLKLCSFDRFPFLSQPKGPSHTKTGWSAKSLQGEKIATAIANYGECSEVLVFVGG